jgi:CPA1 family monovalent cation:H+ antiporter
MPDAIPLFLVIAGVIAWFNRRFLKLPSTIGVMASALVLSGVLIVLDQFGVWIPRNAGKQLLAQLDFSAVVMQGLLSVLLFASAMQTDLTRLRAYGVQVALLAFGGTLGSALVVAAVMYVALPLVGLHLSFAYCLVFGALIAPTDPISVTGILREIGAPANLETVISGESLFNDGVGIVLFTLATSLVSPGPAPTAGQAALLLLREAGGGILFGLLLGYVAFLMLRSIDSYQEEVLLTVAAVVGGYALAQRLGISAPLAAVMAGLVVGTQGREKGMSKRTRQQVDQFWELLDSICNAVLFMLIGLEALVLDYNGARLGAGILAVVATLLARLAVVGFPVALLRTRAKLPPGAWQVLTWGGLRGGISVALALSLPPGEERDLLVAMTYLVVIFSVLAQGLSVGPVVRRLVPCTG